MLFPFSHQMVGMESRHARATKISPFHPTRHGKDIAFREPLAHVLTLIALMMFAPLMMAVPMPAFEVEFRQHRLTRTTRTARGRR
jgi:hypothetical protein